MLVIALLLSVLVTAVMSSPGSAQVDCASFGSSSGVAAEAVATCATAPGKLTLEPVGCDAVSYALVVKDDTDTAVFASQVISDHSIEPIVVDADFSEGYDNHFGVVLDVLGVAGEAAFTGSVVYAEFGDRRFSETGRWWSRTCWSVDESGLLSVDLTDGPFPEGNEVRLSELIRLARAKVQPKPPPAVLHSGPASLMQLPTWWWVEGGWWGTENLGRESHGLMSVTVAAVPARWQLESDYRALVACVGRGVEWAQGLPDSVGCTATFSEDIDVGEQRLQLGVELEVFWTSSIDGYGVQSLPSINLTTPSDHMVVEVIGLGTPSSS